MGLEEYTRIKGSADFEVRSPEAVAEDTTQHEIHVAMLRRALLLIEGSPGYKLTSLEFPAHNQDDRPGYHPSFECIKIRMEREDA